MPHILIGIMGPGDIACGMGAGTASEVAIALKIGKPILLLKPDVESQTFFYSLSTEQMYCIFQPDEAIARIRGILMAT